MSLSHMHWTLVRVRCKHYRRLILVWMQQGSLQMKIHVQVVLAHSRTERSTYFSRNDRLLPKELLIYCSPTNRLNKEKSPQQSDLEF